MKKNIIIIVVVVLLLSFTWKKYGSKIKAKTLEFLDLGIEETGGNNANFNNAEFKQKMKEAGWSSGASWCMFFAKMVYENVFPNLKQDFRKSLSGSTQTSWKNVKNGKSDSLKIVTSGPAQVGDIVIWQNYDNPAFGHAGIVTKVKGNKYESTEGNTSSGIHTIEHDLKYNKTDNYHTDKKLLGFIRKK